MTKNNFVGKLVRTISFLLILLSFVSPVQIFAQRAGGSSTAGTNGIKFFQDRQTCTNSYYNIGDFASAARCYEGAGQLACSTNSTACRISTDNKWLAVKNLKDKVCNQKYSAKDYVGAGACYDVGINLSCNSIYNNSSLCSDFTSNRNLVNRVLNNQIAAVSTSFDNINYINQINQLNSFKTACNLNWPNQLNSFIDCSREGANAACRLSGAEARNLCSTFNSNRRLGERTLRNCTFNNFRSNNYSYCPNNSTLNTIAAGAAVLTVGCLIAGCFNGNNNSTTSNTGGARSSGPSGSSSSSGSGGGGSGQF